MKKNEFVPTFKDLGKELARQVKREKGRAILIGVILIGVAVGFGLNGWLCVGIGVLGATGEVQAERILA
jgi:hypothetical protein